MTALRSTSPRSMSLRAGPRRRSVFLRSLSLPSGSWVPPRLTAVRIVSVLAIGALVGAVLSLLAALVIGAPYAAHRQVLLRVWSIDSLVLSGQTADINSTDLSDAATIFTSDDVIDEARSQLGDETVTRTDLATSVSAVPSATSDFVSLTVTGPDRDAADMRAQAVASAFVLVVRQKVLASAAQIADQTSGSSDAVTADIAARAQAVSELDPVQVYTTTGTAPTGASLSTIVAAGMVGGIGLAALVVILLAFGPARLRDPQDVMDELATPSIHWRADDTTLVRDRGLPGELLAASRHGIVALCPARPEDVDALDDFGAWLVQESADDTVLGPGHAPDTGVVLLDPPSTVLPPALDTVAIAVLVTRAGAPAKSTDQAAAMLARWRPVDAVILVG